MKFQLFFVIYILLVWGTRAQAARTTVNSLQALVSAYSNAQPGDTIVVANGTYNWGEINLVNTAGTSTSAWIILKAATTSGVTFTGSTFIKFSGTRIRIDGFRFANGSAGTNPVIGFRSSTSSFANYSRVSNITIDNYNTLSADTTVENEWIGIFGVRNRVDHCTFINKSNPRATVVVWYSTATFPAKSVSTYHQIDSNYFRGRSYMGGNGGETIRVGVGNNSKTDGYNVIEYNLFENCIQTEPEIVSNKSYRNIYRYNTFRNCNGGLTLRMGRYCEVYGNYFIVTDATKTDSYGIRVIDKGHRITNNYFEGLLGGSGSLTNMRAPITVFNGSFSSADSTNPAILNGEYLPADSAIIAFNTVVNGYSGAGIRLGFRNNGANPYQPVGIKLGNNIIKMAAGQAVDLNAANTSLTYTAEGNLYNAPGGLGLSNTAGFTSNTLNFGTRSNGILPPPVSGVQDASISSSWYAQMLGGIDAQRQIRSAVYDIGCDELNGTGDVLTGPLDSSKVGAGSNFFATYPYSPVNLTILSGTGCSCPVGNLASNDATYYTISSTTKGTRKLDWYASVFISQPATTVNKMTINYDGRHSASKNQLLYLYNWVTGSWLQLDSRTVSTSDVTISKIQSTSLASYISSAGEVRVRVYSSGGSTNYTCSGDWMQVVIESSALPAAPMNTQGGSPFISTVREDITDVTGLRLTVEGNPSRDGFRLRVQSERNKPVTVMITDILGRRQEVITGLDIGQTIYVGSDFTPGVYFATLLQDNERIVVKLIKSR